MTAGLLGPVHGVVGSEMISSGFSPRSNKVTPMLKVIDRWPALVGIGLAMVRLPLPPIQWVKFSG